ITIVYIFQKLSPRLRWNNASTMRRCPVELTGKNSVRPSTIPSKIDNRKSFMKPLLLRAHQSECELPLPLPSRKPCRRQSFRSWLIAESPRPRAARDRHPPLFQISPSAKNRPCIRCRDKSRCVLFAGRIPLLHSASFLQFPQRRARPSPLLF